MFYKRGGLKNCHAFLLYRACLTIWWRRFYDYSSVAVIKDSPAPAEDMNNKDESVAPKTLFFIAFLDQISDFTHFFEIFAKFPKKIVTNSLFTALCT
jgi:hypothetical protein